MIIGNNDYGNFSSRFLDKKTFAKGVNDINNDNEFKMLLPKDSNEFIFCGYVDFKQSINSNRGLNIKLEIQNSELEKMKNVLIEQKNKIEKLKEVMEKQE